MAGRPTKYNKKVEQEILSAIEEGSPINKLCKKKGIPSRATIHKWLADNKEFSDKYARARKVRAAHFEDEIITIADSVEEDQASIQKAKLQIESRKWLMGKMDSPKYGEKTKHITDDGEGGDAPIQPLVIVKRYIGPNNEE